MVRAFVWISAILLCVFCALLTGAMAGAILDALGSRPHTQDSGFSIVFAISLLIFLVPLWRARGMIAKQYP